MIALNELIRTIEKIIVELNANGKIESAIFFTNRYNETIKCDDQVYLEIVETLSTCRAMSQYANFSQEEEMLLNDVVDNAIAVKNKVT